MMFVEREDDVVRGKILLKWENEHPTTNGNFQDGMFSFEVLTSPCHLHRTIVLCYRI